MDAGTKPQTLAVLRVLNQIAPDIFWTTEHAAAFIHALEAQEYELIFRARERAERAKT